MKIGQHFYQLPAGVRAELERAGELIYRVRDLAQLLSESRTPPPAGPSSRRACRGCGRVAEIRYLKIVATSAGWRLLCASCRSAVNSDTP